MFYATTYSLDTQPACFSVLLEGLRGYLEKIKDTKIDKSDSIHNEERTQLEMKLKKLGYEDDEIKNWTEKMFRRPNDEKLLEPFVEI